MACHQGFICLTTAITTTHFFNHFQKSFHFCDWLDRFDWIFSFRISWAGRASSWSIVAKESCWVWANRAEVRISFIRSDGRNKVCLHPIVDLRRSNLPCTWTHLLSRCRRKTSVLKFMYGRLEQLAAMESHLLHLLFPSFSTSSSFESLLNESPSARSVIDSVDRLPESSTFVSSITNPFSSSSSSGIRFSSVCLNRKTNWMQTRFIFVNKSQLSLPRWWSTFQVDDFHLRLIQYRCKDRHLPRQHHPSYLPGRTSSFDPDWGLHRCRHLHRINHFH